MTPETAQALERLERKWRKRAEDRDEQGWVTLVNCANELRDKLATLRARRAGRDGEAVEYLKDLRKEIEKVDEKAMGYRTCGQYRAYSVKSNLLCIIDNIGATLTGALTEGGSRE